MDFFERLSRVANQLGDRTLDALNKRMELAWALLERGDVTAAVEAFHQLTVEHPTHAPAWHGLALAQQALQERTGTLGAEALHSLEKALALAPTDPALWHTLGRIHEHHARWPEAFAAYYAAWKHQPAKELRVTVALHLGEAHRSQGQPLHALRWFRQALADAPQQGSVWQQVARTLQALDHREEALEAWRKVTQVLSQPAEAWFHMGALLASTQPVEADQAYQAALAAQPGLAQVWVARAQLALHQGHAALAVAHAQQAERATAQFPLSPKPAALQTLLPGEAAWVQAQAYQAQAAWYEALAAYQRLTDGTPTNRLDERLHFAVRHGFLDQALVWSQDPRLAESPLQALVHALDPALPFDTAWARLAPWRNESTSGPDPLSLTACWAAAHLAHRHQRLPEVLQALHSLWLATPNDMWLLQQMTAWFAPSQATTSDLINQASGSRCKAERDPARSVQGDMSTGSAVTTQQMPRAAIYETACTFPAWLEQLTPLLQRLPEPAPWLHTVHTAQAELETPLRVLVMGEFNAGKSTFVNAWVEEEVLPAGITPTTAVITTLRRGPVRTCTLHFHDGTQQAIPWEQRHTWLQSLAETEAATIEQVVLTLPHPHLQGLELVDTPGLNAWLTWHEDLTRTWFARADVALWLLTADQAGKATEHEALFALREAHPPVVLGILNKVDRLRTSPEGEAPLQATLATVLAHVRESSVGTLLHDVLPLSGRDAWLGHKEQDAALLQQSNLPTLLQRIRGLVANTPALKQQRLHAQLQAWLTALQSHVAGLAPTPPSPLPAWNPAQQAHHLLEGERRHWLAHMTQAYTQLAHDLLDFLPPRGLLRETPLPAWDREFLAQRLHTLWTDLCQGSVKRVTQQWQQALVLLQPFVDTTLQTATPTEAFLAFLQGALSGGLLDPLCQHALPQVDRTEAAVVRLLERTLPTSLAHLHQHWLDPLRLVVQERLAQAYAHAQCQWAAQAWPSVLHRITLTQPLETLASAYIAMSTDKKQQVQ